MKMSAFGQRMTSGAGILSLMDDLGKALAKGGMVMMGTGNPGAIPEIEAVMAKRLRELADDPQALRSLIGIYDPPSGEQDFLEALAAMLRKEYGWNIGAENICLTNGSQVAFFLLFNLFAGRSPEGEKRKILLPLAPEYIGYADLGLEDDFFTSLRPRIEIIGNHFFKYRVDFEQLAITGEIAAICVSRPTNPTGNVLTDNELARLSGLAEAHRIPLIIDNAYGLPFPSMIYTEAAPFWNEHTILCMSLSKFGLPAVRTGIVVANREVIQMLAGANAVVNLATGSLGPMLTTGLIRSGEIIRLSREVIRPFYENKMKKALAAIEEFFSGLEYRIHLPEGAMFLWLWFPGLPISCRELYERLKERGVVVVSGDYFFPGLPPGWSHTQECIRVTYAREETEVRKGLEIIADEVRRLFSQLKPKG